MTGINIVPVSGDEIPFIVDAWARSFRDSPWAGCISNELYQEAQRATINGLLARGARVSVAIPTEGPRRVLGFVVTEAPDIVHYVYTKNAARHLGVAGALITHVGFVGGRFTHRTPASEFLFRRGFSWNPIPARLTEWKP